MRTRRRGGNGLDAWPGYVDALSTLLMVIIFVLLVFVLAQAFLTASISGQNKTLGQLSSTLSAERGRSERLRDEEAAMAAQIAALRQQLGLAGDEAEAARRRNAVLSGQLSASQSLAEDERSQVASLGAQLEQLNDQLRQLSAALAVSRDADRDKDAQINDLGRKLNAALASRVEELQRYRSEFFGRLRDVLANRPGIQVVGDRFVFQSEVLFPAGSADLTRAGGDQIRALATTLIGLGHEIPADLRWVLRVDGHADRQPVAAGGPFASNWELSSQRAINVVKLLIAEGVPPEHLAATAFADYQPLDHGDTAEALSRNRRIEIRLTDR